MPKKFSIEIFKDVVSPELDSDIVAHALATVESIKPYVEIINRNRYLRLSESHGEIVLDRSKRIRVPLDSHAAVLYTSRHISCDPEDDIGVKTMGVYLDDSKLCIVSSDSKSTPSTARHEVGHALYGVGLVGRTMDKTTEHCNSSGCVMQDRIEYEKRRIETSPMRRIAESMGLKAVQFESAIKSVDFCSSCSDALATAARFRLLIKEDELAGRGALESYLAQQD